MPLIQSLSVRTPLPHISAFPIQQGVPPLHTLAVHATPPPPLSVLIQVIGVPPRLTSAVHAHAPLI